MSAFQGQCCEGLQTVQRICDQHNLGIGTTIEIIEACDIDAIPDPDSNTHTVSTDIALDAGKFWYQWRIGETDAEFTSTPIGKKSNQTFRNTLTFYLPLMRDELEYMLNRIINGEFVIRFSDRNGDRRILGTDAAPAMIPEGGINGVNSLEQNGYTISFENTGHTPYFYTGAVPLTV